MTILYHHRTGSKDGQAVHIEELTAALKILGHDVTDVVTESPRTTVRQEFGERNRLVAMLKQRLSPYHLGSQVKAALRKQ